MPANAITPQSFGEILEMAWNLPEAATVATINTNMNALRTPVATVGSTVFRPIFPVIVMRAAVTAARRP